MDSTPLVSIIIPFYNTEEYLPKCLESLKKQTYKNIELIFTNDGSTDNSQHVVEQFIQGNPQLTALLINQDNLGPSEARNRALDISHGDFLFFLDSDDYLPSHAISSLVSASCDEDIIIGGKEVLHNGLVIQTDIPSSLLVLPQIDALKLALNMKNNTHLATCKLYRASFIKGNNIRFIPGRIYEDIAFSYDSLTNCKTVKYIPDTVYFCIVRSDSIMRNITNKNVKDYTFMIKYIVNLILSNPDSHLLKQDMLKTLIHAIIFLMNMYLQASIDIALLKESVSQLIPLLEKIKLIH